MPETRSRQPTLFDRKTYPHAFPRLTPEQMKRLEPLATCHRFEDGEALFEAGERGIGLFVISQGKVRIVKPESDGTETLLTVHGPGDFTGELQLINHQPSIVRAVAQGPSRAMRIDHDNIQKVLAGDSEIGDIILRALLERRALLEERKVSGVQLIGSRWSPRTFELKDFLARNRVLFRWDDPEQNPEIEALLQRWEVAPDQTPVVICSAGGLMRNPTIERIAQCMGLRPKVDQEIFDVAILGGGPAGLAAAVYAASEGLKTLVLDAIAPGGQAGTSSKIENYLGFPMGISGAELASAATTQARKFSAVISTPSRAAALDCAGPLKTIELESSEGNGAEQVHARSVILATGARYRKLEAANRQRFQQRGIYYAATFTEAAPCRGEELVVVGGGNSAGQAAVFLSGFASKVHLLVRGPSLAASMSRYLIDRIERSQKIELRTRCRITAFNGGERLESVTVHCDDGSQSELATRGVFVMIGADPNTEWMNRCLGLDDRGFVVTGSLASRHGQFQEHWGGEDREPYLLETTRPGVFAVGDVRSESVKRVASAVGEGAMAVKFVHQVLG